MGYISIYIYIYTTTDGLVKLFNNSDIKKTIADDSDLFL